MNRENIQTQFLDEIIEGLDIESLVTIAYEYLGRAYDDLSDADFLDLVQNDAPHLLDEETI
jgi:hypothetical protein